MSSSIDSKPRPLLVDPVQPTPAPTGNTTNLNTVFNDASGVTWFVDNEGEAIALNNPQGPPISIIDNTITDPNLITEPGTYIIPAGGTGVFAGQTTKYGSFDGTSWTFAAPATGDRRAITTGPNAGIVFSWNGTVWAPVSTVTPDFWRSGAGAIAFPDGTTDITETIRRNGNVGLNVDAISTLDVAGSHGLAVRTVAANTTANATDSLIMSSAAGAITVTLPTAASSTRRIYTIKLAPGNLTGTVNVAGANIEGLSGALGASFPISQSLREATWQSNGTNWNLISAVISAGGVVAEYGEQVVAGSVTIPTVSSNSATATDIVSFILPSAGVWEVDYIIRGATPSIPSSASAGMAVSVHDNGNVLVPNSELKLLREFHTTLAVYSSDIQATGTGKAYITTTGAATYKIRGFHDGTTAGSPWAVQSDNNGRSKVSWKKISGQVPVTGQSLEYIQVGSATLNQPTTAGAAVIFPTILAAGGIPYNTANGQFTLTAGKTYRLEGSPTAGVVYWYNVTGAVNISEDNAGNALSNAANLVAVSYFTPTVNSIVELRAAVTGAQTSANGIGNGSFTAVIQQVGSSATTPFAGATAVAAGTSGFTPAPAAGQQSSFLRGDGTWAAMRRGNIAMGDVGTGTTATGTGDITSVVKANGALPTSSTLTVNFAAMPNANYVAVLSPYGTGTVGADNDVMTPMIFNKTTTSFQVYLEETSSSVQNYNLGMILIGV